MLKIGLTGNIGSGKSTVSSIFALLGIPVFKADEASKKFLDDKTVQEKIRDHFGGTVFYTTGTIDRKALGALVFSDKNKLALLNGILHPLVKQNFHEWLEMHQDSPYTIHEAAILFESGFQDPCLPGTPEFDRVIHVSCPADQCIQRVMERDKVAKEAILERMAHQWSDEKKAGLSDFVIANDGSELVIPQVLGIHEILLDLSVKKK